MIVNQELASIIAKELKLKGKRIVFTNGCFDILHCGHTTYLNKAKQLGDVLFLGLNSDDSVRKLKGENRPINNEGDRAEVMDSLKSIDFVVIFDEETPLDLITMIIPDVLVKGGDYTKDNIVGADLVELNGGDVVTIAFVDGKSTTNIINKMKN